LNTQLIYFIVNQLWFKELPRIRKSNYRECYEAVKFDFLISNSQDFFLADFGFLLDLT